MSIFGATERATSGLTSQNVTLSANLPATPGAGTAISLQGQIIAQQAGSANVKAVTTANDVLTATINVKR
jgi:hypothetical protein